ncbi:CDP-diacylglycerol--glycerol-3-phosphate 3-phosphatidyltransferase [Rhodococcus coprophilus]|uniref:CDP-diacylglycerol--glycerol-3-phosphate 3-phosphatidyltransferase n=1 Tax=Rhodococcus coprophilus TaxID=38310 RepID=A0A2X4TNT9_9NOCA|nr:CDP-diacylglycerol--glycerol-3-phosphate 3-phosphatidyltransferase [Rhodococcus coprophilus]MBM7461303.1 CDP-diacylglycerol--glycerol-3-phosphate 3-phosphatidyltransferase [Rhodococcus coprophilus]SQI29217.1 cdp-diacylglycerol-glycerol-3-phosphate 3-phosphatidyltransferase [Rhodococcus coprophilus]
MSTPRQHVAASGGSGAAPGPNAGSPHDPVPLWNIANILTVVRIALVPVFLVLLFVGDGHDTGWRLAATAVFAIAAVTDRIDGQLARRYGLVTDFGKMADPIADKALIGAALVGLSLLGDLTWWVTAIIAARELGITAMRFAVLRHGVIPASRGGKAKTFVQTLAIGIYLLPLPDAIAPVAVALMVLAVALTVVTGLDYVVQAVRLRTAVKAGEPSHDDTGDRASS